METLFDNIIILIFVLQALHALYKRLFGSDDPDEEEAAQPLVELMPDVVETMLAETASQVGRAQAKVQALTVQVGRLLENAAGSRGLNRVLLDHLQTTTEAELKFCREQLNTIETLRSEKGEIAAAAFANQSDQMSKVFRDLVRIEREVAAVSAQVNLRVSDEMAQYREIGDRLVRSTFESLHKSVRVNHSTQVSEPVTYLDSVAQPSLPVNLLGGRPLVGIPMEARFEPNAWATVVKASVTAFLLKSPEFRQELLAQFETPSGNHLSTLPRREGSRVVYDPRAILFGWRDSIISEVISTVVLGPAYVYGLQRILERPDDPESVMDAETSVDGRSYASSPPAHLRILLLCDTLESLGFAHEGSSIRRRWFELHGQSDGMVSETQWGQFIRVPWDGLLMVGAQLVREIVRVPMRTLRESALIASPHLAMTPERWTLVGKMTAGWSAGQHVGGDPLTHLSALLLAGADEDHRQHKFFRFFRDGILNRRQFQSKKRTAPGVQRPSADRPISLQECTEAFLLRFVLRRPHSGRGRDNNRRLDLI